jgi:hypothetical protein
VEKAPHSFLDWSEDAITFSHEDHPNRIPNPGQFSLVVNPVIGNSSIQDADGRRQQPQNSCTRTPCS